MARSTRSVAEDNAHTSTEETRTGRLALKVNDPHCDVTFITRTDRIRAHRFVLYDSSPFFKTMLHTATPGPLEISLGQVKAEIVMKWLNYLYHGTVSFPPFDRLDNETAACILGLGHRFHTTRYLKLFYDHVCVRMTWSTSSLLFVVRLCHLMQDKGLTANMKKYIIANVDIIFGGIVQQLSDLLLILTIMEDWETETDIWKWNAILRWTNASPDVIRLGLFPDLIKKVEYMNLDESVVKSVILEDNCVRTSLSSYRYIEQAAIYKNTWRVSDVRRSKISEIVIVDLATTLIYQLDMDESKWFKIYHVPMIQSKWLEVASYRGRIYAGNGLEMWTFDGYSWEKVFTRTRPSVWVSERYNRIIGCDDYVAMVTSFSVVRYHVHTRTSREVLRIYDVEVTNGKGFSVASSGNTIYVMGGYDTAFRAVEIDLVRCRFQILSHMSHPRISGTACVVDKTVVVFGGPSGAIEYFSAADHRWHTVDYTRIIADHHRAFLLKNNVLYFIGKIGHQAASVMHPIRFGESVRITFEKLAKMSE